MTTVQSSQVSWPKWSSSNRRSERLKSQPLESALERRRRLFDEVLADFDARGVGLRMADNLPREAIYDRSAPRSEADSRSTAR